MSQFITLYVTPVIYLYMELFQEKVLDRIPFFATHYEGHAATADLERTMGTAMATGKPAMGRRDRCCPVHQQQD